MRGRSSHAQLLGHGLEWLLAAGHEYDLVPRLRVAAGDRSAKSGSGSKYGDALRHGTTSSILTVGSG
jgi:hypothetical protein